MPAYQSTFEIDAAPERVWSVLTDFNRYAEWNPQIPFISGAAEAGSQISLRLVLPGKSPMELRATLEEVRPASLLTWRGRLVAPWFFEGYRKFEISPVGDGRARVTHVEDVRGLIAPVFGALMGDAVRKSQAALNQALRVRAQGATSP